MRPDAARTAPFVAGILLAGYGGLVLLRLLAHESTLVGAGLLTAGLLLAWSARSTLFPSSSKPPEPDVEGSSSGYRLVTAALGLACAGGVLAYKLASRAPFGAPDLAIVAYGLMLLCAAPYLGRRVGRARVASLVAWSLPLVAAPLGMYALDGILDASRGSSPLDAFVRVGLVVPMAWTLNLFGFDVLQTSQTVMIGTPRGRLALTIGVVCAGLQPAVLFLGVLGLHAWQQQTPPRRLALYLGLGLVGVYLANLVRLVALALVGNQWGGSALQTAHAHLGWAVFIGWMLIFWGVVLRRLEGADPERRAARS